MSYMSKKKAAEIIDECLDELFRTAKPSFTWKEIHEKFAGTRVPIWKISYLSEKAYDKIVEKYKKKLTPTYRSSLSWELMNYSPTCNKDIVLSEDEYLAMLI